MQLELGQAEAGYRCRGRKQAEAEEELEVGAEPREHQV